jgi:hypothetical protein
MGTEYDILISKFEKSFIFNENSIIHNTTFWNCNFRLLKAMPTTTNALEGYHRSVNNKFNTAHPNFARFLEFLQKEERRVHHMIYEVITGKLQSRRNKKYDEIENVILGSKYLEIEEILSVLAKIITVKCE